MERRAFLRRGWAALALPALWEGENLFPFPFATPRQRRQQGGPLRLSSNENPLGIPPGAREAILEGLREANRYPGASRQALLEAVAGRHGVEPEAVVLGNGSTEILQMGVQMLMDAPLRLVVAHPTYEDVTRYAEPHPSIEVRPVPVKDDGSHDLEGMAKAAVGTRGRVLVYLCNPNNPTGSVNPVGEVEAWIRQAPEAVHFLVDEAYFEFVRDPDHRSLDRLAVELPNLVVARTFSKIYGMAGLRLGYALTHPDTARRLRALAARQNTNHLALQAGRAALADSRWVRESLAVNQRSREVTEAILRELDLEFFPSHTNFVMHRIRGPVEDFNRRMADAGILVGRPFPPFTDRCRVSLGLPEDMERYGETLRDFRKKGWV